MNEQHPCLRYDPRGVRETIGWYGGFAGVYAATVSVGFWMRFGEDHLAVFWPAVGCLAAALTLLRCRHWPMLLVLASLVMLGAHLVFDGVQRAELQWLLIPLTILTNLGEALIFAVVMQRCVRSTSPLYSVRKLGIYVVLGVLLNTAAFTLIGTDLLWMIDGTTDLMGVWLAWFFGDYIGLLAVGTAILAWAGDRGDRLTPSQRFEAVAMLGSLGVASALLFALPRIEAMELLAPVLVLPWVVWSLARFRARFVALSGLIITLATVVSMRFETGPFSAPGTTTGMQVLAAQSYLMPTLLSLFFLATAIEGRRQEMAKRLAAQEELRLLEKSQALGTMAAGVAHDFGNLMMAIQAYQSTLRMTVPPDLAAARKAIDGIGEAAAEAKALTGSLMSMSMQDHISQGLTGSAADGPMSGYRAESTSPHDLRESVGSAVAAAESLLPKTMRLVVEVSDEPVMVQISQGEVQRIVTNLLINSRDASADRAGVVRVQVERAGSEARMTITDNGQGMSVQVRERMFDPFFTTKLRGKGTGLGLAVVRSLVTEHGGSVAVESEEGYGTSIIVLLPLCKQDM